MKADLHVHSVYSDGRYTPEEICNRAFEYGVELISITDHDTLLCQVNKRAAAKKYGLKYVAGWEISAHHDDRKLHILGYNCKGNSVYDDFIKTNSKNAILRMEDRLAKLKKEGIVVTMDEVFAYRQKGTPIHTMHLSYALAKKLKTTSDEAYNAFLRKGAVAYSPLGRPTPYEALEVIKGCGGFAVLAHPGRVEMPAAELGRLIEGLAAQGLAGIETIYTTHTKQQTEYFAEMAKGLKLLTTGGSDTHYEDETHAIGRPYFTPSEGLLERLEIL